MVPRLLLLVVTNPFELEGWIPDRLMDRGECFMLIELQSLFSSASYRSNEVVWKNYSLGNLRNSKIGRRFRPQAHPCHLERQTPEIFWYVEALTRNSTQICCAVDSTNSVHWCYTQRDVNYSTCSYYISPLNFSWTKFIFVRPNLPYTVVEL